MYLIEPKQVLIFADNNGKQPFLEWLKKLDKITRSRIEQRIIRISLGNYGDYKAIKDGLYELRFCFGAGYRVYFGEDFDNIVILLSGGDKSMQNKDIKKAIEYWKDCKNDPEISEIPRLLN